jgi:hypothetical protein
MTFTAAIDELDALAAELTDLGRQLARPGLDGDEDGLWELEVALRHLSTRAAARADLLRRQIDRINQLRRSA